MRGSDTIPGVPEQDAALEEAAESHAESLDMRQAVTQLDAALRDSEGQRCARESSLMQPAHLRHGNASACAAMPHLHLATCMIRLSSVSMQARNAGREAAAREPAAAPLRMHNPPCQHKGCMQARDAGEDFCSMCALHTHEIRHISMHAARRHAMAAEKRQLESQLLRTEGEVAVAERELSGSARSASSSGELPRRLRLSGYRTPLPDDGEEDSDRYGRAPMLSYICAHLHAGWTFWTFRVGRWPVLGRLIGRFFIHACMRAWVVVLCSALQTDSCMHMA
jgi:hypothetical protein